MTNNHPLPLYLLNGPNFNNVKYDMYGLTFFLRISRDVSRNEIIIDVERKGKPTMPVPALSGPLFVNCMYDHVVFPVFFSKDSLIKDILDSAAIVRVSTRGES